MGNSNNFNRPFKNMFSNESQQNHNQKKTNSNYAQQKYEDSANKDGNEFKFEPLTKENIAKKILNAEEIAKIFGKKNTYTQIRKFYDELLSLQKRIKQESLSDNSSFEKVLPMIYLVKSKAAYACGRNNINDIFLNFISYYIERTKKPEDLDNFLLYFEAVLGYLKYYTK